MPAIPHTEPSFHDHQMQMFNASVLKRAKWREIKDAAGDTTGLNALDLGADNGVISYLLRSGGGSWTSADLTHETVSAISGMVGDRVHLLNGHALPFNSGSFDMIVVVDMLEHVENDTGLMREIGRCLLPGGKVIMSVPALKKFSLLRSLRNIIGLTDKWHGHVHHGYTRSSLEAILPKGLGIESMHSYSRSFSHFIDTALNWVFLRKSRRTAAVIPTAKGMVVTGKAATHRDVRTLRRAYPLLKAFASLDRLLWWADGYMLLVVLQTNVPRIRS